jgi:hypothetical protein
LHPLRNSPNPSRTRFAIDESVSLGMEEEADELNSGRNTRPLTALTTPTDREVFQP